MRVLLTNDDGIDAPGLAALRRALDGVAAFTRIDVVAPAKVQSATSHAVTFHRPIRVEPRDLPWGRGFAVDGRPADCVKLALAGVLHEPDATPVDLVVSGMNAGANVGINVLYSGTVGAAREATFEGLPAIAVSLHIGDWDHDHWDRAAEHAADTVRATVDHGIDPGTLVNVNVPVLDGGAEPVGTRVCPVAATPMVSGYDREALPDGTHTYTAHRGMDFGSYAPDTDVAFLFDKFITVSPLHFDLTCRDTLTKWADFAGATHA